MTDAQTMLASTTATPPQQAGASSAARASWSLKWPHLLILTGAFGALFWMNLQRLWHWTNPSSGDANWGHAMFIPLISLIWLLEHRDRLKKTPLRPAGTGLLVIFTGILLFVGGIGVSSNFAQFGPYLQDFAMLVTLFGCVLAVFGWPMVRTAMFPMAYLLCALPWPPYVHDLLTFPLQKIAATASVHVLQLTGINAEQAGNTIRILSASGAERTLNVAEACSGMRSLITFFAIGLAIAFLSARPLWQKIIISLSAIPIAIACNIFRIAGEGLLDHYVSRSVSEGFAHAAIGVVLLAPGFALFLAVGWGLDRLTRKRPKPPRVTEKNTSAVSPAPGAASRRMYFATVCILLTSAVALGATSRALHLHFVKIPVPLTHPLAQLPADLGPWRQCGGNQTLSSATQESLGANEYIFRDYVDSRILGPDAVESIRHDAGGTMIGKLIAARPQAAVRLAVTYYTGHVDAVIHQSERCNLADGLATSIETKPETWDLPSGPLGVRVVHLISDSPRPSAPHFVAYCYCVNGHEETEAWRVRGLLMNVFAREAWYAKIEVATTLPDRAEAQQVMKDFLASALPQIESCLPRMNSDRQTTGAH